MDWPTSEDYGEAVQNLKYSMSDGELRAGEAAADAFGLPMLWAGGFADVYKIYNPKTKNTWALKCFTRKVTGQQDRYRHISDHLKKARLPFMVDFSFLNEGIRIRGRWYPALKMRWVEGGIRLNEFVEEYLERPRMLRQLLTLWPKMASRLRKKEIAHTDLQHGNVLLVPRSDKRLALRLIDYDGMHVPALADTPSAELGHPAFQHPQRSREGVYSAEIDRFSHLAIYTAVHSLTVGGKELWERFNNGDNLLFRKEDFARPEDSELFRQLWTLPDVDAGTLAGRVFLATRRPLVDSPLLEHVLSNGSAVPLDHRDEAHLASVLGTRRVSPRKQTFPLRKHGPSLTDYRMAILDMSECVSDEELRRGEPFLNANGIPHSCPGGFADVFTVSCPASGKTWAMKCFKKEQLGLRERYVSLNSYLRGLHLPFIVPFQFIEPGIYAAGQWRPFLKMRWVDGIDLNRYVSRCLKQPAKLRELLQQWHKLAVRLRLAQVVHGDLQHRHVLVTRGRNDEVSLKLIDYDGMTVPGLEPAVGTGHPGFQHPKCASGIDRSPDVDRFPELTVYCAIHSLMTGGSDLWRFDNGDGLLFREEDFARPENSELFRQLWMSSDTDTRALVGHLLMATQDLPAKTPVLEELLHTGMVAPLSFQEEKHIVRMLSGNSTSKPTTLHAVAPRQIELPNYTNSIGMKFKVIPAGTFMMGNTQHTADDEVAETLQHQVRISRPFYLGVYQVTQAQYQKVMGRNPSQFKEPSRPVENVSWQDAAAFCKKLSVMELGFFKYRLPTEAEWEYACRAGTTTQYSCGDELTSEYAWISNNSDETHPVGLKLANAWGLYDMHGNVYEWCQDWYDKAYYTKSPMDDPEGPITGSLRVCRGGGWNEQGRFCNSADRSSDRPIHRYYDLGFRTVAVPTK